MGAGFVILDLFGIFILIISVVSFFVFKKYGYKKTGILVSFFLALIVIIPAFLFAFESELYFKSDAKKDLELVKIELNDDFKIISNEIIGLQDYYQTTYLQISKSDRNKIISEIKSSKNHETNVPGFIQVKDSIINNRIISNQLWNYKEGKYFVRQFYVKTEDFAPINLVITLKYESDTLKISRIED